MAHATAWWSGPSGDEGRHWLGDVRLDECRRLLLGGAANLAHHQDRLGLRVVLEEPQHIDERRAGDGVATDADTGRLSQAEVGQLPDRLVGQCAAAADDADRARRVDVTGHDADLALPRRDDPRAVRPD